MPFVNDLRLDVLSTLTPEAVEKIRPFRDYVLIRRTPTRTMSAGGLHIPSIAQDEPMEGIVIAVGPGRVFPQRFCDDCGEVATMSRRFVECAGCGGDSALALTLLKNGQAYTESGLWKSCAACLEDVRANMLTLPRIKGEDAIFTFDEEPIDPETVGARYACNDHAIRDATPLLERRPVGVEKGQRVVFSKHAGGRQFKRVRGPDGKIVEYILTDDVIGACEPGCGMVERSERYA
jgi:co-chaperonin GroES (HSP10)